MRKVAGMLLALAAVLPLGAFATPAGASGGTICKSVSGTIAFSPALPKLSSSAKVKSTVTIRGAKVGGCSGGGVTTGTMSVTLKFGTASNCSTVANGTSTNAKGSATLVWNTNQSSTAAVTLKAVKGNPRAQMLAGSVSSGLFKGSKLSVTTMFMVGSSVCTSTGLSKAPFNNVTVLKIV